VLLRDAAVDVHPQPVLLVAVVAPLHHEHTGSSERGDVVDVSVGVAVEREPVRQPQHVARAELVREDVLDVALRQVGVAVRGA
jgi:hypothetical protein